MSACRHSLQIIECLFHIHAHKCELGTRIYILNHYTAGVILFGEREEIHFDSYGAIVSFVHVDVITSNEEDLCSKTDWVHIMEEE
ncbi:hypothetical protein F7725_028842 [Dissostichus mawsoni]|uniref:Uncharacterized protein n=1 Tax=Dissostichus mawsoni TaxID=36200 RepID=A0A7J5XGX7_DISMA|nr:hypothetical protein F7725_028842 [Dissostichus mawsoni]